MDHVKVRNKKKFNSILIQIVLAPVLQNIATKNSNIKVTKIDVDQHSDLIEEKFPNQSVQSIPYVIGVVNGKAVNHFVGLLSEEKINEFIKTLKE